MSIVPVSVGTLSATLSPAFGQATTAGHLLIAWVSSNNDSVTDLFTVSGTGWVKITTNGGQYDWATIYYKPNCGASETAPVFSAAGTNYAEGSVLAEFSGAAATTPLDSFGDSGGSVSGTTTAAYTASDAGAGDLIVYAACWLGGSGTNTMSSMVDSSGTAVTPTSPGTGINGNYSYLFAYGIAGSTGSNKDTASALNSGLGSGQSVIASFLAAAGPAITNGTALLTGAAAVTANQTIIFTPHVLLSGTVSLLAAFGAAGIASLSGTANITAKAIQGAINSIKGTAVTTAQPTATGKSYITSLGGVPGPGYFVDNNGRPKLWVASETWGIPGNAGRWNGSGGGTYQQDFDNFCSQRAAQGLTVIMTDLVGTTIEGWLTQNGNTWDGVTPFNTGTDPTSGLNNTFWQRQDYLVNSAKNNGLTVAWVFDAYTWSTGGAFSTWTTTQAQAFGTAFGNQIRYVQPNIIWLFGNDESPGSQDSQFDAIRTGLTGAGDTHICRRMVVC